MSRTPDFATEPKRLLAEHGPEAALLRAAGEEYQRGIDPSGPWRRLEQRRRWAIALNVTAVAACSAAAGFLVWGLVRSMPMRQADEASLEPEKITAPAAALPDPSPPRPAVQAPIVPSAQPLTPLPPKTAKPATPTETPAPEGSMEEQIAPPSEPSALAPVPSVPVAPTASASPAASSPECLQFVRNGQPRVAEQCFQQRAAGDGLAAQLALYELARLRKDALGDAPGAHRALLEYRSRFPLGSLRTEVEVSIIELLVRMGHYQAALAESEQLLSGPAGAERKAQLRLLRGNIYRVNLKDCARALPEYRSIARDASARGDQASYNYASCLEELGRRQEAAQAFREYLKRTNPARKAQAEQRLNQLDLQ